jgi:hypothetical protein
MPHSALDQLPAGNLISQMVLGLPQVRLEEHVRGNDVPDPNDPSSQFTPTGRPKKPTEHMLGRDNADMIGALLGVPARDVNLKVAQELQKRLDQATTKASTSRRSRSVRRRTTNHFNIP